MDRGETFSPVALESVRSELVGSWRSGDEYGWTLRTLTIRRITDTRYVVHLAGRDDHAGCRAYETPEAAMAVAEQLKTNPDITGYDPGWRDTMRPKESD